MSDKDTNRERSRHEDVRVHFSRNMVRDGSVKLMKCAGTQNVADALKGSSWEIETTGFDPDIVFLSTHW